MLVHMTKTRYYRFLNNIANPLRISIIECLYSGKKSVGEMVVELKVEQSKLSHALSNMKCCRIVDVEQVGKNRYYSLNKDTIVPILKIIDKHAKKNCKNKCCFCE